MSARLLRFGLTTGDAEALARFYEQALGFERAGAEARGGPGFARLMGVEGARAHVVMLRLGRQMVELTGFARPGARIPADAAANDLAFQHFAIVVSDMRAACARLEAAPDWAPISRAGPQRLPARSGGVTAFKFRDPEGHPLELLAFPPDAVPPAWRGAGAGPCLGIDHSAITVADTDRSAGFYTRGLGFGTGTRSLNQGSEQAALDGVPDPVVEVTALLPGEGSPPHLELLRYRAPRTGRPAPAAKRSDDLATTRLVLAVEDVAATARKLVGLGAHPVSTDGAEADGRPGALLRDPDGHDLLLTTIEGSAEPG